MIFEQRLLEDHGMTLPPEKQPLRGLDPYLPFSVDRSYVVQQFRRHHSASQFRP